MPIEYVSEHLTASEMRRIYDELAGFVSAFAGHEPVSVMYGALSGIHTDLWYKPMTVGSNWFERFMRESEAKSIIGPGESDFLLTFRSGQEVTLCHELDIHVKAEHGQTVESLLATSAFVSLVGGVPFKQRG